MNDKMVAKSTQGVFLRLYDVPLPETSPGEITRGTGPVFLLGGSRPCLMVKTDFRVQHRWRMNLHTGGDEHSRGEN